MINKFICLPNGQVTPFQIKEIIGRGGFGIVFAGLNCKTKIKVAIKMEHKDAPLRQLYLEFGFYHRLGKPCAFAPNILTFGKVGVWHALVMELLGPSLLKMTETVGPFSVTCTTAVATCLLDIFNYIHKKGILFRDTKPENFLLGRPNSAQAYSLYIIDLGLCKEWRNGKGRHIAQSSNHRLIGTPAHMSINQHKGEQVSRKDDIESLWYVLIDLHKGSLPWTNQTGDMEFDEWEELVWQIKRQTKPENLCAQMEHFHLCTFSNKYAICHLRQSQTTRVTRPSL